MSEVTESPVPDHKEDGWQQGKSLFCILFSRFSSSSRSDSVNHDEVLKPLYYIVGDSSSEQMEATVQSIEDDQSKEKNETETNNSQQSRLLGRTNLQFHGSKESPDGVTFETLSVKRFGNDESMLFRSANSTTINKRIDVEKNANYASKMSLFAMLHTLSIAIGRRSSGCRRKLGRIFKFTCLRGSSRHSKCKSPSISMECSCEHETKCDSHSKSEEDSCDEHSSQSKTKDEKSYSDDTSVEEITTLGVAYAHPVYTGKRKLMKPKAKPAIITDFWQKFEVDFALENNKFSLPLTETVVETTTAKSWGSIASSSLYPTDEQSIDEDFFYCNSFDSDVDLPFDETSGDYY